jgi:large subunit ribosomal protein L10
MPSKKNLEMYEEIGKIIKEYGSNIVSIDFRGLNVESVSKLRNEIRKMGGKLKVLKNTVFTKYVKNELGWDYRFEGVNGFIFASDNVVDILKFLVKIQKEINFQINWAIFEGKFYDSKATVELSKLPSKQEIIAYLVGAVGSGVSSFVWTINNVVQSFVLVLKAIEDKK